MTKKNDNAPLVLSVYSHKGGVGKTSLVHAIGELNLPSTVHAGTLHRNRILMIDLDTQMNLTAKILGNEESFDNYFKSIHPLHNLTPHDITRDIKDVRSKLTRVTNIAAMRCADQMNALNPNPIIVHSRLVDGEEAKEAKETTDGTPILHLIPGSPDFYLLARQMELELQDKNSAINYCGAISLLIKYYHSKFNYDLVILDLGPDLYSFNCVALWSSDYILSPCGLDIYSTMSFYLMRERIFPSPGRFEHQHPYYRMNSRLKMLGFLPNKVKTISESLTMTDQQAITMLEDRFMANLSTYLYRPNPHFCNLPDHLASHPCWIKLITASVVVPNQTKSWNALKYCQDTERRVIYQNMTMLVDWLNYTLGAPV